MPLFGSLDGDQEQELAAANRSGGMARDPDERHADVLESRGKAHDRKQRGHSSDDWLSMLTLSGRYREGAAHRNFDGTKLGHVGAVW
jgi:hypothetical protein